MTDSTEPSAPIQTQTDAVTPAQEGDSKVASTPPEAIDPVAKEGEAQATPEVAPEKYEAFKLPEGFKLEGDRLEKLHSLAKESGWTQARAQSAVDTFCADIASSQQAAHAAQVEAWGAQLKSDPEIGGANYEGNLQTAGKAVAKFGGPDMVNLLNETGLGNHPVIVKAFLQVGKAISEGDLPGLGGAPPKPAPLTLAEKLYGKSMTA